MLSLTLRWDTEIHHSLEYPLKVIEGHSLLLCKEFVKVGCMHLRSNFGHCTYTSTAITGKQVTQSDSAVGVSQAENRNHGRNTSPRKGHQTPHSRSSSPSRAASPFRGLFNGWNLHRTHSRDEPFVPVNPWQSHLRWFGSPSSTPQRRPLDLGAECHDTFTACLPLPVQCTDPSSRFRTWVSNLGVFFADRKSTRLNSSHSGESRMPSSA